MNPPKPGRALEGEELEERKEQHEAIAERFREVIEQRENAQHGD